MKNKKKIRHNFRTSVFKRDKYTCLICSKKHESEETLDAHHITDRNLMPNGGYVKENGITLCKDECHMIAEEFHITNGEKWYIGYHPNDLYEMIGSTKDVAIEKSKLL